MAVKTKKTLEFLQSGEKNSINSLISRVKRIAELDPVIKAELSSPLRDHCRVANIRNGKVVIQADNPVWGSKLRFEIIPLLATLRKQPRFAGLAGIDFFVAPFAVTEAIQPSTTEGKKHTPISTDHRQLLLDTAEKVSDPKLKAVLQAIAARK